jgi:hypothetical protein
MMSIRMKKKAIELATHARCTYSIPFPINYAFAILLQLQILVKEL